MTEVSGFQRQAVPESLERLKEAQMLGPKLRAPGGGGWQGLIIWISSKFPSDPEAAGLGPRFENHCLRPLCPAHIWDAFFFCLCKRVASWTTSKAPQTPWLCSSPILDAGLFVTILIAFQHFFIPLSWAIKHRPNIQNSKFEVQNLKTEQFVRTHYFPFCFLNSFYG